MYSCFSPKRIINRYTGEVVYTPCRTCEACATARSRELSSRIEREMLNPSNKSCFLITLDYNNEKLPVYTLDPEDGSWHSNRAGFTVLEDVLEYYRPINHPEEHCFGHLCYQDTLKFFVDVRSRLRDAYRCKHKSLEIQSLFRDSTYEDLKFRYFLCGEYGPTTYRPHYHILVWFKRRFTDEQLRYVSQVFHSCWTLGSVDFQAVTSGGVKNYLSNYVTSSVGLPPVLRLKSIKPFCTFSKRPTIGTYEVDNSEIQQILATGIIDRTRWDHQEKTFVDEYLSPSFFSRLFPKCQGFGYKDNPLRVRVYSYVFNYFKDAGITHSPSELDDLRLCDIEFPKLKVGPNAYEEWSYTDKYASLVAYRYCCLFNLTPESVLSAFDRVYSRLQLSALGRFYEEQDEMAKSHDKQSSVH